MTKQSIKAPGPLVLFLGTIYGMNLALEAIISIECLLQKIEHIAKTWHLVIHQWYNAQCTKEAVHWIVFTQWADKHRCLRNEEVML